MVKTMKTNIIKQTKEEKGLTYQQMGQLTGLHPMLVYQHCSGQKKVSFRSALAYNKAFKIPYHKLAEDE